MRLGQYQEEEQLYREALAMKKILLGDSHPAIAAGLNNVAFSLQAQGKYDAAEALYLDAITMQRKLLGVDHPDVAQALNNLAFLAHDKGDLTTAAKLSRESLEMFRRTLGNEHPQVAQAMQNLGHVAVRGRRSGLSRAAGAGGTRNAPQAPGAGAFRCCGQHDAAGGSAGRDGTLRGSASALRRGAKAIWVKALPPGHWRTASAEAAEGAALAGLGQFKEAEQLLLASHEVLQKDKTAVHVYQINSEPVARKALPSHRAARKGGTISPRATQDADRRLMTADRSSPAGVNLGDIISTYRRAPPVSSCRSNNKGASYGRREQALRKESVVCEQKNRKISAEGQVRKGVRGGSDGLRPAEAIRNHQGTYEDVFRN